jgi:hypothetical protein
VYEFKNCTNQYFSYLLVDTRTNDFDKADGKTQLFHRNEKFLLFPDENFAKSYEKLTNLTDGFSSAFHTFLQNFRQEKIEIFLFYGKADFFVSFVKIVCTALKSSFSLISSCIIGKEEQGILQVTLDFRK